MHTFVQILNSVECSLCPIKVQTINKFLCRLRELRYLVINMIILICKFSDCHTCGHAMPPKRWVRAISRALYRYNITYCMGIGAHKH